MINRLLQAALLLVGAKSPLSTKDHTLDRQWLMSKPIKDSKELVLMTADWWTSRELGMDWPNENWKEKLLESDVTDKFIHWYNEANRCLDVVQKNKIPMTLNSMESALNGTVSVTPYG